MAHGTYDLPTYTVDLTPFIPLLTDGDSHIISLDVVSDEEDHSSNPNWYLSGNIQVALDRSGLPTTGSIIRYEVPPYATSQHSVVSLEQDSYNFTVDASRSLAIEAVVITGSGKKNHVVWKQDFHFNNIQTYLDGATKMVRTSL